MGVRSRIRLRYLRHSNLNHELTLIVKTMGGVPIQHLREVSSSGRELKCNRQATVTIMIIVETTKRAWRTWNSRSLLRHLIRCPPAVCLVAFAKEELRYESENDDIANDKSWIPQNRENTVDNAITSPRA